jgi:hypothetical protein
LCALRDGRHVREALTATGVDGDAYRLRKEDDRPMSAMNMQATLPDTDRIVAEAESAVAVIKDARAAIGHVIYGQETVVERALITIFPRPSWWKRLASCSASRSAASSSLPT